MLRVTFATKKNSLFRLAPRTSTALLPCRRLRAPDFAIATAASSIQQRHFTHESVASAEAGLDSLQAELDEEDTVMNKIPMLDRAQFQTLYDNYELCIKQKRKEIDKMEQTKHALDVIARRYPDRYIYLGLAFLVVQNAVLFNWTYFRFDWNLVEPITYLLGYGCVWLGLACYFSTGKEFSYDNLRAMAEEKHRGELYASTKFDVKKYQHMLYELEEYERKANALRLLSCLKK